MSRFRRRGFARGVHKYDLPANQTRAGGVTGFVHPTGSKPDRGRVYLDGRVPSHQLMRELRPLAHDTDIRERQTPITYSEVRSPGRNRIIRHPHAPKPQPRPALPAPTAAELGDHLATTPRPSSRPTRRSNPRIQTRSMRTDSRTPTKSPTLASRQLSTGTRGDRVFEPDALARPASASARAA
jgi:hypothetical protein